MKQIKTTIILLSWICIAFPVIFISCAIASPYIFLCLCLGELETIHAMNDRMGEALKQVIINSVK
jgi:hypothetical protein